MKIELYQAETEKTCRFHQSILDEVSARLKQADTLSNLETNGVIHSLQVLIENAIGKTKHLLKFHGKNIPVSGYDAFEALKHNQLISASDLSKWQKIIGFRNTIVHEYVNVDLDLVNKIVINKEYQIIIDFLLKPFA